MIDRMIYFIKPVGADGPIKIGFSKDPLKRIKHIQPSSPSILEIAATAPATLYTENAVHRRFINLRIHGEWFTSDPELESLIEHCRVYNTLPAWLVVPKDHKECCMFNRQYPDGMTKPKALEQKP